MSNFPLTEQDRNRIQAEEVYREQLRDQLAKEKPLPSPCAQVWLFLNSQVGGWLLSTVLVGFTVLLYGLFSDHLKEQAARAEQRCKIANELAFRIQTYDRIKRNGSAIEMRRRALDGEYPPRFVYPELQGRAIVSLLWELAGHCDTQVAEKSLRSQACDFNDTLAIGQKLDGIQLDKAVDSLRVQIANLLPDKHFASPATLKQKSAPKPSAQP